MKKQAVCEYCGKIFEDNPDEEICSDYKQECVEHEITHLNLDELFKINLIKALEFIDEKYNSLSKIIKIDLSACWDSYYGRDVTYNFEIENTKITKRIKSKIEVQYDYKEKIPTSEEIISLLNQHFFIPTIENKYEGVFRCEDEDGANDYVIGESSMNNIYEMFKGKKVKIEVVK